MACVAPLMSPLNSAGFAEQCRRLGGIQDCTLQEPSQHRVACPESVIRGIRDADLRTRLYWVTSGTTSYKGKLKKPDMTHLKIAKNCHRTVATGVLCGSERRDGTGCERKARPVCRGAGLSSQDAVTSRAWGF